MKMELPKNPPKSPVKRAKPKAGQAQLFFKGLPEDVRFKSHSIPESMERAKGTLYETWFNALQLSPYYQRICETNEFPSEQAEKTFHLFGDLSNTTFEKWWVATGYGIFAEKKPFNRVSVNNEKDATGEDVPILRLEIPLNVSPKTLRNQFDDLLELHHPYYKDFDRWKASTADVRFENKKLTSASLDLYLEIYKEYLANGNDLGLYELGVQKRVNPKLVVLPSDRPKEAADKRVKMANAVSEYIEKAKNLVAYATEGIFPCVENHHWIERKTRNVSKYDDE
jgi:hypothetical protein